MVCLFFTCNQKAPQISEDVPDIDSVATQAQDITKTVKLSEPRRLGSVSFTMTIVEIVIMAVLLAAKTILGVPVQKTFVTWVSNQVIYVVPNLRVAKNACSGINSCRYSGDARCIGFNTCGVPVCMQTTQDSFKNRKERKT
ncbi:hypothetical protein ACROYT_G018770 [Oculina patagonica]